MTFYGPTGCLDIAGVICRINPVKPIVRVFLVAQGRALRWIN